MMNQLSLGCQVEVWKNEPENSDRPPPVLSERLADELIKEVVPRRWLAPTPIPTSLPPAFPAPKVLAGIVNVTRTKPVAIKTPRMQIGGESQAAGSRWPVGAPHTWHASDAKQVLPFDGAWRALS